MVLIEKLAISANALVDSSTLFLITRTRIFIYIENFATKKWKLSDENLR